MGTGSVYINQFGRKWVRVRFISSGYRFGLEGTGSVIERVPVRFTEGTGSVIEVFPSVEISREARKFLGIFSSTQGKFARSAENFYSLQGRVLVRFREMRNGYGFGLGKWGEGYGFGLGEMGDGYGFGLQIG